MRLGSAGRGVPVGQTVTFDSLVENRREVQDDRADVGVRDAAAPQHIDLDRCACAQGRGAARRRRQRVQQPHGRHRAEFGGPGEPAEDVDHHLGPAQGVVHGHGAVISQRNNDQGALGDGRQDGDGCRGRPGRSGRPDRERREERGLRGRDRQDDGLDVGVRDGPCPGDWHDAGLAHAQRLDSRIAGRVEHALSGDRDEPAATPGDERRGRACRLAGAPARRLDRRLLELLAGCEGMGSRAHGRLQAGSRRRHGRHEERHDDQDDNRDQTPTADAPYAARSNARRSRLQHGPAPRSPAADKYRSPRPGCRGPSRGCRRVACGRQASGPQPITWLPQGAHGDGAGRRVVENRRWARGSSSAHPGLGRVTPPAGARRLSRRIPGTPPALPTAEEESSRGPMLTGAGRMRKSRMD